MEDEEEIEIRGEYWIENGGFIHNADGDIGDYNHEGVAIEHVVSIFSDKIISLADELDIKYKINYHEINSEEISSLINDIEEYLLTQGEKNPDQYIQKEIGASPEAFHILVGSGNPSLYVMKNEGWIAVRGNNVDVYGYDEKKRKSLERGIENIIESEGIDDNIPDEEIELSLHDFKTQRQTYVTLADIKNQSPRPNIQHTTKGDRRFTLPTFDSGENQLTMNKSKQNRWNVSAQKHKLIGPGQQIWRGTSESVLPTFTEWLKNR